MPIKINYHQNKSKDEEHEIPCIKCSGKTAHKVLTSIDVHGSDGDENFSFDWVTEYQIVQCLGCKTVSFRETSSNSEDMVQIGYNECEYAITEHLYPSRVVGIKGLGEGTIYLPSNVKRVYEETLAALSNQSPILAAIGLRALLETVCKEKNAQGNDLLKKIDNLVTQGILTPTSALILHKIRSLGNSAAHEVKPHTPQQLELAIDIIEHLLKDVYILPKQVETQFGSNA